MKRLATLPLLLALCSSAYAVADLGWRSPNPDTRLELVNSVLTVTATASAGGIYNSRPLNLPDPDRGLLVIELKTSRDGLGEVAWKTAGADFSFIKSLPFYLKRPGQYHTYYLDLAAYNRDRAPIDHLLFFPLGGPGSATIKELKFIKGTWREKLMAGWQEFWGPAGREPAGTDILFIRSPRLLGQPFVLYLNVFLLAGLIAAALARRPKYFLAALLVAWSLLEASTLLGNSLTIRRDWKYVGKSLTEKRRLVNTPGFYDFLVYADALLPPGAAFNIKTPGHADDRRARYYLYPRLQQADAKYLLIYKVRIRPGRLAGYRLLSTYEEGAYIFEHVAGY